MWYNIYINKKYKEHTNVNEEIISSDNIPFSGIEFEWDENKAEDNLRKHGVSFKEAATIFDDPYLDIDADELHSNDEERFKAIGFSEQSRVLFVIHCYRENDTVIRIISARKAEPQEEEAYYGKS
jgi:uncharacterized DUF497 family protein